MKPTREGQYCRTPEGVLCRVTYIDEEGHARLYQADGQGEYLMCPLADLTRVSDPSRVKVPVEGMPAERPRCPWCDKPLRPWLRTIYSEERPRRAIKKVWNRWQGYNGLFCTLKCALWFATASYKGGYRRVK